MIFERYSTSRSFFALFLACMCLVACNSGNSPENWEDTPLVVLPDTLPRFDSIPKPAELQGYSWTFEEKNIIENNCESTACSKISWRWFNLEANAALKDSVDRFNWYYLTGIPGARKQDLDSIAASFFREAKADVPAGTKVQGWEEQNEAWPAFATANTFTLGGRVYFDNGGITGSFASHLENFDATTGKRLVLQSIVNQPYSLLAAGELIFRKNKGIDAATPLSHAGFTFPEGVFYLPETFGIHPEGLVFVYSPAEIASPAEGEQFILIPYSTLKDNLRPEYQYLAK